MTISGAIAQKANFDRAFKESVALSFLFGRITPDYPPKPAKRDLKHLFQQFQRIQSLHSVQAVRTETLSKLRVTGAVTALACRQRRYLA